LASFGSPLFGKLAAVLLVALLWGVMLARDYAKAKKSQTFVAQEQERSGVWP